MAATSRVLLSHNLKRCIGTTTRNSGKYAAREGRFLGKLLGSDSGKRKWYETKNRSAGAVSAEKLTSNHVTRRMTVLNKLFMQHITDLMATGEVSTELLGKSIEVSHVRVTPDFLQVLVFWFSKQEDPHSEIEKLLHDCSFRLRHELTQLRVIGRVPIIKFVKNRQLAAMEELEKRLKIADYGDEHEPNLPGYVAKEELVLTTKLQPEVRQQILALDAVRDQEDEELNEDAFSDLPPMRHDVLGLDHHAIMSRVKHSLSKSNEASKNRLLNVVTFTSSGTKATEFNPAAFEAAKNDSKAFANFLAKRRMEEKQKIRRERRAHYMKDTETDYYEDDVGDYAKDDGDVDVFEDISLESVRGME